MEREIQYEDLKFDQEEIVEIEDRMISNRNSLMILSFDVKMYIDIDRNYVDLIDENREMNERNCLEFDFHVFYARISMHKDLKTESKDSSSPTIEFSYPKINIQLTDVHLNDNLFERNISDTKLSFRHSSSNHSA